MAGCASLSRPTGHFTAARVSSPVSSQTIGGEWTPTGGIGSYGNGTKYDLYIWDEPQSCWFYQLDTTATKWKAVHPGTIFVPGRGYLYAVQSVASPIKAFTGSLNNGIFTIPLTRVGKLKDGSTAPYIGFNLIGNPYPSAIDWKASTGWTRAILTDSLGGYNMWIWNPSANNYGVYNSVFPTDQGTNNITRYIAPMQSFFVRAAASGNLVMNNNVRVHDHSTSWKSATTKRIWNPDANTPDARSRSASSAATTRFATPSRTGWAA